jgi:hypothetical protein
MLGNSKASCYWTVTSQQSVLSEIVLQRPSYMQLVEVFRMRHCFANQWSTARLISHVTIADSANHILDRVWISEALSPSLTLVPGIAVRIDWLSSHKSALTKLNTILPRRSLNRSSYVICTKLSYHFSLSRTRLATVWGTSKYYCLTNLPWGSWGWERTNWPTTNSWTPAFDLLTRSKGGYVGTLRRSIL